MVFRSVDYLQHRKELLLDPQTRGRSKDKLRERAQRMQSTCGVVLSLTHNVSLASNLAREALYWSSHLVDLTIIPALNPSLPRDDSAYLKQTTPGNFACG